MITFIPLARGIISVEGPTGDRRYSIFPIGELSAVACSIGIGHRRIRQVFGPAELEDCKAWIEREVLISQGGTEGTEKSAKHNSGQSTKEVPTVSGPASFPPLPPVETGRIGIKQEGAESAERGEQ